MNSYSSNSRLEWQDCTSTHTAALYANALTICFAYIAAAMVLYEQAGEAGCLAFTISSISSLH